MDLLKPLVSLLALSVACCPAAATAAQPAERIVNLGDSITDGQTYPLLVEQALREAGKPTPRFIGAGIGGDTAGGMLQRLDRDVFSQRPTLVMLSCGINDVSKGVEPSQYEEQVTAIAERMKAEHVRLMILTTTNLQAAQADKRLEEFNAALHRVAEKYGLTVAKVYGRMQEGRKQESTLWEPDGCHLNFAGYRYMARAVLDALGYPDVPVARELSLTPLPGVVRQWKVLPLAERRVPLDEKSVLALAPDDQWRDYTLPEKEKIDSWWFDQERQRGVSVSMPTRFGPAKGFLAVTDIDSPQAKDAFLNTGAELTAVWLNGKRILGPADPQRGWHPGSYRKPVKLQAGKNRIIVETSGRFFVSITDREDW